MVIVGSGKADIKPTQEIGNFYRISPICFEINSCP